MSAMVRYCECGHSFSDHDEGQDCEVGWEDSEIGEPGEECDCIGFRFDFEEAR